MTPLPAALENIRLLLSDVDGVLTDGTLVYGADGEVFKHFNVRDGLGIGLLRLAGIKVGIVSGRSSPALLRRLQDLGIDKFRVGTADKAAACLELMAENGLGAEHTAFIGDDLVDLPAFAVCGTAVAVADAHAVVRARADLVLETAGGRGAFRELADAILHAQGRDDIASGNCFLAQSVAPPVQ